MALDLTSALAGGVLGFLAGMVVLMIIISLAIYIYMGFAFMAIGKKAKLKSPGLAWIPGVGPMIIAFKISKMHWWPWLLLIGCLIPFVNFIAGIILTIFVMIWHWKMFEALKRPGWWTLFVIIPIIGSIIWLILIGITAWSKK